MDYIDRAEGKIGYSFGDKGLLATALTHTSYANEHRKQKVRHNERLEFLGDAVLEAVSSDYLFKLYPDKGEGELSRIRASMVCEPSLAICFKELKLQEELRLGNGEIAIGGMEKDSITSDAMEAVIGAIYLDGGFEAAKEFVTRCVLNTLKPEDLARDDKTVLQEIVQEKGGSVTYVLTGESGPDHDKCFSVEARIGEKVIGKGEGRTKKAASKAAAAAALKAFAKR